MIGNQWFFSRDGEFMFTGKTFVREKLFTVKSCPSQRIRQTSILSTDVTSRGEYYLTNDNKSALSVCILFFFHETSVQSFEKNRY